ncbi:MAG: MerC domain-containing protein [Bacteroidia bacterium]|nr:MerC domain-containing protein [Bacteroidia bacterium]
MIQRSISAPFRPGRLSGRLSDVLGISSSLVCLAHCLAGPIMLGAAAHAHDTAEAGSWWLHPGWNYVFLVLSFVAVRFSVRHMASRVLRGVLWGTFGLLGIALLFESAGEWLEYAVYAASGLLIVLHTASLLQRRRSARLRTLQEAVSDPCCTPSHITSIPAAEHPAAA